MWCLWRSWLARQIVALEAESSNLSRHPTKDRTGAFLHGLFFYNGSSPSGKARDFDSRIREFEPRRPNHSSSCMNVQGELLFCRGDHWSPADACGNGKPSGRIWNPPLRRRGRCSSSTRKGSGCRTAGGRPLAAPTYLIEAGQALSGSPVRISAGHFCGTRWDWCLRPCGSIWKNRPKSRSRSARRSGSG